MTADGSIIIDTRINTDGIQNAIPSMEQNFSRLGASVKKFGLAIGAAFAIKKVISFGQECLELGSDLQEVQNVVDSVFTTMNDQVNEFAQNAAVTAGLSETMAKKYMGTFGAMAKSFGFTEQEAYNMSESLTQLTGDVASFYNLSQDEAYTKLKSVFTGETESLKELGVVMTQSALDQYALANGFGKTTSAMTEQEKVALRQKFVLQQLSTASGDFIRTSDGWANQIRILKLQFESLKATIGQGLINILTPVVKVINILLSKLATLANAFKSFTQLISGGSSSGNSGSTASAAETYDSAADSASNYADATEDVADATKEAAAANKKYLSGLDEIKTFTSNDTDTSIGSIGNAGGSVAGSAVDFGTLSQGETVVEELDNEFTELFEHLKASIAPLAEQIERFGSISRDAFTWLLNNVLKPLAEFTITEVVPRFFQTLANVLSIVNSILIALQPLWQWFWDYILLPVATWTGGVFLQIWDGINSALSKFSAWCMENPGVIQTMAIVIGALFAAITLVNTALKTWKTVSGLATTAATLLSNAVSWLKSPFGIAVIAITAIIAAGVLLYQNWDTVKEKAKELKEWLIEKFEDIRSKVTESVENLRKKASDAFSNFWKKVETVCEDINDELVELAGYVTGAFEKDWTEVFGTNLGTVINGFFDYISDQADAIKEILLGLTMFIDGVFSGDWEKAWQGIRNIFSGIWKALVNIVKVPINGIIGLMNSMIKTVNDMLSTIENVLKFDFKVPNPIGDGYIVNWQWQAKLPRIKGSIPYLASGAVIPPNAPFMAVLGDQKRGTNIETPESLLRQIIQEELGSNQGGGGNYRFTAQINRRTLFDEMINEAKLRQMQSGKNPFEFA